jgi:prepilin-type N-terminal cleavage/methylation domain-containing protein
MPAHTSTMPRFPQAGFTLIEMLVATFIFIIGFTSVYALFLSGIKYRAEADAITRSSVAASNIINEMRLGIISPPYSTPEFQSYRDQPGLFYQVYNEDQIGSTPARKISLYFVRIPVAKSSISEADVRRRFRRIGDDPAGPSINELVDRGIIRSYPAVIYPMQ